MRDKEIAEHIISEKDDSDVGNDQIFEEKYNSLCSLIETAIYSYGLSPLQREILHESFSQIYTENEQSEEATSLSVFSALTDNLLSQSSPVARSLGYDLQPYAKGMRTLKTRKS